MLIVEIEKYLINNFMTLFSCATSSFNEKNQIYKVLQLFCVVVKSNCPGIPYGDN